MFRSSERASLGGIGGIGGGGGGGGGGGAFPRIDLRSPCMLRWPCFRVGPFFAFLSTYSHCCQNPQKYGAGP